jgi:hypothetical protein
MIMSMLRPRLADPLNAQGYEDVDPFIGTAGDAKFLLSG